MFFDFKSPAHVGDIDGDCKLDLIVGASGDDSSAELDAGAIWVLFLEGQLQATTAVRNGSGANALAYTSTSDPRLGRNWTSEVDVTGHPGATISILFAAQAAFAMAVPLVSGIAADEWGIAAAFYLFGAASVAAAGVTLITRERARAA